MKIRLRQKVDQGGAESEPLLPGQEFEVQRGPHPEPPKKGVYISPESGVLLYLQPWQFTYIG